MWKNNNIQNNFKGFVNPSKFICNHLVGTEHKLIHRVIVGTIIMVIGVYITKWALHGSELLIVHVIGDTIGFLLHGIGAIPYVELFIKLNDNYRGRKK